MKVFLAGLHGDIKWLPIIKPIFVLESFFYLKKGLLEYVKTDDCKDFMLDSGAFTFMKSGKDSDWFKYLDQYIACINEHNIDKFFELDIDKIVGLKKVEEFRKILEKETGKQCIPVWHRSRGLDYFKRMTEEYGYIGIGGFAIKDIERKEYVYIPKLLSIAKQNNCKVHGLGFTSQKQLQLCRFDSVDSTTWFRARFGDVAYFDGKEMKMHRDPTRRVKHKESTVHNLTEWVKFQHYADKYL